MGLPVLSIVAFAIAIIVSCVSQINVGFLSIAFAFIIGVLFGGMRATDVAAGFPAIFFFLATALASIGAGNIATTALLAPVAMTVAGNLRISAFLMTVCVCCGAN